MSRDTKPPLSAFIRRRREELGMSQEELAKKVNRHPTQISQWESGSNVKSEYWLPSGDALPLLAAALRVSLADVVHIAFNQSPQGEAATTDFPSLVDQMSLQITNADTTKEARTAALAGLNAARQVHETQRQVQQMASFMTSLTPPKEKRSEGQ